MISQASQECNVGYWRWVFFWKCGLCDRVCEGWRFLSVKSNSSERELWGVSDEGGKIAVDRVSEWRVGE